jgi:N-acetylmuramoyl-L-alanine amidase
VIRLSIGMLGAVAALSALLAAPARAAGVPVTPTNAKVFVAGKAIAFQHLGIAYADPVAPAGDAGLRAMLAQVQAQIGWQPGTRFAVVTRADGVLITLTVGSNALSIDGRPVAMPFAPFYRDADLYVPLLPLARALQLGVRGFRGGYVFVPQVLSITAHSDAHRTVVSMTTSAPAAYRSAFDAKHGVLSIMFPGFGTDALGTLPLSGRDGTDVRTTEGGPPGFPTTTVAIGVKHGIRFAAHRVDGALAIDAVLARSDAALHLDDSTKAVGHVTRTAQGTPAPATASPASASPSAPPARPQEQAPTSPTPAPVQTAHPVFVARPTPTPTPTPVVGPMPTPTPRATPTPVASPAVTTSAAASPMTSGPTPAALGSPSPTPTSAEQRITDVSVTDIPNGGTRLTLTLTGGPVSFEWHRLADPDNRYWLDIKGVTLAGPSQTLTSGLPFVKEIHITQFQVDPERIVRIAVDPTQAIDVNVGPVAQSSNQMGIEIERTPPQEDAPRAGVGTIAFVSGQTTPVPRTPTQRDLVVIDPGHGGNDPGASNSAYGLTESNITLTVSLKLRDDLRRLGWRVAMTRDGNYEVGDPNGDDHQELQARCDVANAAGARVFVSVHVNSSVAHSLNGTTTYYWRPADKPYAQAVQSAVVMADGINDAGIKRNSFYVIKNTTMPAVLVETAFLSNSHDAEELTHTDFLDKLAQGIANGIMNFTGGPQAPL